MPVIIWHHMAVAEDEWPHTYGKPTDCYCEPEVRIIDDVHRLVEALTVNQLNDD